MRTALACLLLASCEAQGGHPVVGAVPAQQTVIKTVCPPLRTYGPAQEQSMALAVAQLPPDSPIVEFIDDYGALRAVIRACKP